MKQIVTFIFSLLITIATTAQPIRFVADVVPLDLPYHRLSAQTYGQHVCGNPKCGLKGAVMAFGSPSMRQAAAAGKSFQSAVNHGIYKLWNRKPTNDPLRKLINWGGEATTSAFSYLLITYLPLGSGWVHEEFHRSALMRRRVYSYNDIYSFRLLAESVAVSRVTDEELIGLKQKYPVDHIRAAAAGIEGEYQIVSSMQKDAFFYDIRSGSTSPIFYLLSTASTSGYVRSCAKPDVDQFTDEMNAKESTVAIRDWVGLDFSAWVYDLHRPDEPYTDRGIHPSGVGIDRYIKYSDLTPDMLKYLQLMGNRQLLNYLNPQNFGIRRFKLGQSKSGEQRWGNIALRHYLTSFGDDMNLDLYFKQGDINLYAVIHRYGNNTGSSPGLEVQWVDQPVQIKKLPVSFTLRAMVWAQPRDQSFFARQRQAGGLVGLQVRTGRGRVWQPYLEAETKTVGWVAGNPFLDANVSVRAGLMAFVK